MPSCCLWLPWHPLLPKCALSNQFTWLVQALFFQYHNKQPWDTQGNKGYEPKVLNSIFKAANEPAQPSPMRWKKGKGLNSRSCKMAWAHQMMEDFWMCFTTLSWHNSLGECLDLSQSPSFPTLVQPRGGLVLWCLVHPTAELRTQGPISSSSSNFPSALPSLFFLILYFSETFKYIFWIPTRFSDLADKLWVP